MSAVDVSVVCRAGKAAGDLQAILSEYRDVLAAAGVTAEFLFVLERSCPADPEKLAERIEKYFLTPSGREVAKEVLLN